MLVEEKVACVMIQEELFKKIMTSCISFLYQKFPKKGSRINVQKLHLGLVLLEKNLIGKKYLQLHDKNVK